MNSFLQDYKNALTKKKKEDKDSVRNAIHKLINYLTKDKKIINLAPFLKKITATAEDYKKDRDFRYVRGESLKRFIAISYG